MKWTLYVILSLIVVMVIVIGGTILMDRDANQRAKRSVAERVQRDAKSKEPVYDQNSLNQRSNHKMDREMLKYYANSDRFISKIKYDSKHDVANVYLTKSAAQAVNYVSNSKKAKPRQLSKPIKKGIQIDDRLSNQAVKIANRAHDGYFTFKFANAKNYQAPNTKTGNYNE